MVAIRKASARFPADSVSAARKAMLLRLARAAVEAHSAFTWSGSRGAVTTIGTQQRSRRIAERAPGLITLSLLLQHAGGSPRAL